MILLQLPSLLIQLQQTLMGSGQLHVAENRAAYYNSQIHSVEGEVDVFKIKGKALYAFQRKNTSSQIIQIAKQIKRERCQNLSILYGQLKMDANPQKLGTCQCDNRSKGNSAFWSYQNFTLQKEIIQSKEQNRLPSQRKIWKLISSLSQASQILFKHCIFVDCTLENVFITPLKNYELYWGYSQVANGHRLYYHFLLGESKKEYYPMSPEELKGLKQKKILARLDLQKCVMYSIGILALLYANNQPQYGAIYDSQTNQLKEGPFNSLLKQAKCRLSLELYCLLKKMLEESPNKRINFQYLNKQLQRLSSLNTKADEQFAKVPTEMNTCQSSKISIKNVTK